MLSVVSCRMHAYHGHVAAFANKQVKPVLAQAMPTPKACESAGHATRQIAHGLNRGVTPHVNDRQYAARLITTCTDYDDVGSCAGLELCEAYGLALWQAFIRQRAKGAVLRHGVLAPAFH